MIIFIIIISFALFPTNASAASPSQKTKQLPNGDFIIYSIDDANTDLIQLCSTRITKTKTCRYYHNNTLQWSVSVTGTFTYGSKTSKCISSRVSSKTNAAGWKITKTSASRHKNIASVKATAKHYYNNLLINTLTRTVKLKCSPTGKFS